MKDEELKDGKIVNFFFERHLMNFAVCSNEELN